MTTIHNDFSTIKKLIQANLYLSPLADIKGAFSKLDGENQKTVIGLCRKMMDDKNLSSVRNKELRISVIKLIVAASSYSSELLEMLLKKEYTREQYEVLFTLFCFLDGLLDFPDSNRLCECALSFVREFLLSVRYKTGKAAWMAGELLGAHWDISASLPILFEAAQNGTYAVGREAAVHGLAEALKRVRNIKSKEKINGLFNEIAENDTSRQLRLSAQLYLRNKK